MALNGSENADPAHGTCKVAIVTGAASGMGEALARHLIDEGWKVACFDVQQEAGSELVEPLGSRAAFWKCNVADYDEQSRAFQSVWDRWGRLDALLANAGIVDRGSRYIMDHRNNVSLPPKPDLSCTDIDYKGVVYGVTLAVHFMRMNNTPGGAIVATASIAGLHPHPTYPEYCGAKAAVIHYAQSMAPVLKVKENITFNVVLPGVVRTKIVPQERIDAIGQENITPVSVIIKAYDRFLKDSASTGKVVECSGNNIIEQSPPPMTNGAKTKRAVTVWESSFEKIHHEKSGLKDAVSEPT